jgi:fucose permease
MDDVLVSVIVGGLVTTLRKYVPRIDGWIVPLVVFVVAALVVFAFSPQPFEWQSMLRSVLLIGLGAVGIDTTAAKFTANPVQVATKEIEP